MATPFSFYVDEILVKQWTKSLFYAYKKYIIKVIGKNILLEKKSGSIWVRINDTVETKKTDKDNKTNDL